MNTVRREMSLYGIMLLMLGIAAAWSFNWSLQQRDAAVAEAADLVACRKLAHAIQSLSAQPAVASSVAIDVQELGQRIQGASGQAGLQGNLEGVIPQSARRIGDSPYLEKPTTLSLRGVTLAQTAAFLHHLTSDSGLTVRDLRVRSRRGDAGGKLWDVETTLTYLIYEPKPARSSRK